jgi:hypothetical protein
MMGARRGGLAVAALSPQGLPERSFARAHNRSGRKSPQGDPQGIRGSGFALVAAGR